MDARCASHSEAAAVALCSRCGAFLCGACVELREEAAWCAACVETLRLNAPPSRAVKASIVLGALGLLCFPLLFVGPLVTLLAAAVCLGVSGRELRRIRLGERPLRGRLAARVSAFLGVVNLVFAVLWIGSVVYAISMARR